MSARLLHVMAHAAVAAALLASGLPAQAAELNWPGRPFRTAANETRLADLLRELAASQGTTVVLDPKVDGVVSGRFELGRQAPSTPRKVLDDLCASYGLVWYYDGTLLYVEPATEAREEVFAISPDSAGAVRAALQRLRIGDRRYMLEVSDANGMVYVAGPRRYRDAVREVVRSVDRRAAQRDRSVVRVFPLRYAWALDFEVQRGNSNGNAGRRVVVPGVVNVLRSLFDANGAGSARLARGSGSSAALALPKVSGRRQVELPSGGTASAPQMDLSGGDGSRGEGDDGLRLPGVGRGGELPQFEADPRLNAVLVRDLPERMADHEQLVGSLDMRPRLVEIEVTIMDISSDSLKRLGVDWRAHGRRFDLQTGNGDVPGLSWNGSATADGQTRDSAPVGALFSASIGSELRNFLLARVSALASTGEANFVARPKVLTLENAEASVENKSEFYVKVAGFQDASLFTVVAGTDVRVTPLIVQEAAARGVMLNINIGDDAVSSDLVDNLPVVRRRSVVTQALVEEGKSVLLAGYTSEEKLNNTTAVPGLSEVPVLGRLFRHEEKLRTSVERFYMLTPRFVTPFDTPAPGVGTAPPAAGAPLAAARTARPVDARASSRDTAGATRLARADDTLPALPAAPAGPRALRRVELMPAELQLRRRGPRGVPAVQEPSVLGERTS